MTELSFFAFLKARKLSTCATILFACTPLELHRETQEVMKILLVEDEIKIAEFVLNGLAQAGYQVDHVADGLAGLQVIEQNLHDLVVLDVMLPSLNGFDLLQQLRHKGDATPVIILSAKVDLPDRLHGFEVGADDYLPKPFFVEELVARIKVVLARHAVVKDPMIRSPHLTLDLSTHRAQWYESSAILSQREFSLLAFLMRSPGHIYSRKQILKHVWDINFDPETNVVDVCVRRIKSKLGRQNTDNASPIESVRGVGYRLRVQGEDA